jgi:hypothetical protein
MNDELGISKLELISRLETSWNELMNFVVGLDDTAKTQKVTETGWNVSDHLSHLAAWESGIVYLLTGRPRHEGMGITAQQWDDLTMDEINEEVHRAAVGRTPSEAVARLRMAHEEMLKALEGMTDADLARDYSAFDPGEQYSGRPIVGWIIGNTYDHFDEHLEYMRSGE